MLRWSPDLTRHKAPGHTLINDLTGAGADSPPLIGDLNTPMRNGQGVRARIGFQRIVHTGAGYVARHDGHPESGGRGVEGVVWRAWCGEGVGLEPTSPFG